jgi:class 3 adenylate cyclase
LVTDISGYTALSEHDGPSALVASAIVQKEARQICEANDGNFIKSTGDGAIMYFHSAEEACQAINELHAAITSASSALKIPFHLHSGLHWGEFVQTHDGDIYGQTVNIAARICDRAGQNEVWTSKEFAQRFSGEVPSFLDMGPQNFKNVSQAIHCMKLDPSTHSQLA